MNKKLWKLERIGERLWILATITATQAASLASDGKGIAIVADETRKMANKVSQAVERVMFDEESLQEDKLMALAFEMNLLALNIAIESYRLGYRGKQAAIYANEIRDLAYEIVCLFDKAAAETARKIISPWPTQVMSTVSKGGEFLQFNIGGITFVESLDYVDEVCGPFVDPQDKKITLRGMELPLVDGYKMMGKPKKDVAKQESTYVILQTPWAEKNRRYAVAAEIVCLFRVPIGKPTAAPADMPLAPYVRECWENENGEPIYFMNWPAMIGE